MSAKRLGTEHILAAQTSQQNDENKKYEKSSYN